MVASLLEFVVHAVVWLASDRPVYQSIDAVWTKPLANLAVFVPAALVLRILPLPPRAFLFCLAFPAAAAPLLLFRPGSPLPLLILAAGIATQASRILAPAGRQSAVIRAGAMLAALYVVTAGAMEATRVYRERESPGVAAPSGAPNVLLVILDTVRGASLSLLGGRAGTPHLDTLAANGILFERAISPAPWTLPSHATLFTGLWPHEHGADWRSPLGDGPTTLAEVFARQGYRTGGFVSNLIYTSREHGLDRGFQVYRDYRRSPGAILRSASLGQTLLTTTLVRRLVRFYDVAGRKAGRHVNGEFLDWEGRVAGQPWFAFLNYFDAHEPFVPRAPFAGQYSAGLPPRRFDQLRFWSVEGGMANWSALQPAEVEAERAAYEEAITGLDADIGALLAELRRRGILDRTLVVVTSDHGELFGEHNTHAHGNSTFWRTVHVPLLVSWPGHLVGGQRITTAVSLRDLPASILGLALPGSASALPGNSLLAGRSADSTTSLVLSELSADEFSRNDAPMRNGSLQSVIGEYWQYTRAANGHEDVYHIEQDWSDNLITDVARRTALTAAAHARLSSAKVPAPQPLPARR